MNARPVVLVVDDEIHVVDVLALVLEGLRARVTKAYNGEQALRAVATARPLLVISDVMMPKLGGLELLRRLRADSDTAAIPVVLMSSLPPEAIPDHGADAFLGKPFDLEHVEAVAARRLAGLGRLTGQGGRST